MKKIVLYAGSFNPPGIHHRAIGIALSEKFDEVIVIPFGPRNEMLVNDVEPSYRGTMVDLAFRDLPKVRVDLFDLESTDYTRTFELYKRYKSEGEVWLAVDSFLVRGGAKKHSKIQYEWENGPKLWKEAKFVVIRKTGAIIDPKDLPSTHLIIDVKATGSSAEIREKIFHREKVKALLDPLVSDYVERHGLYLGTRANRSTHLSFEQIRPLIIIDTPTTETRKIASRFPAKPPKDPNLIVVIGGDGAMLRAIRKHWRRRIPFYGINAGHLGFLLNDRSAKLSPAEKLKILQLPLLWVEMESPDGEKKTDFAFNDTWVERARGQTAWIRVLINGKERISNLMADAALVSTAAGSGSYARAMGAQPLPFDTPALLFVGSNVLRPIGWKSAALPLDTEVEFFALDIEKRPLHAFTDGFFHGRVKHMKVRVSHSASVQLVFQPNYDPAEKLAHIQFPWIDETRT